VYLEPGQGAKAVSITVRNTPVAVNIAAPVAGNRIFRINGTPVTLGNVPRGTGRLFVSLYSTSGKLLFRQNIGPDNSDITAKVSAGCYIVGVGAGAQPLAAAPVWLH
jgi:hypothetical protein